MFINLLLIWSIFELVNWINYIFIYFKVLKKTKNLLCEKEITKFINGIVDSDEEELKNIIRASISHEKNKLIKNNNENLEISNLSLVEINNIIKKYILNNKLGDEIDKIRDIIENKLDIKFEDNNNNRYVINEWGNIFISYSFIPLFLNLFTKLIFNSIHYYIIYFLKFKYELYEHNSLGVLYNNYDPNKKTILFIHGFGF